MKKWPTLPGLLSPARVPSTHHHLVEVFQQVHLLLLVHQGYAANEDALEAGGMGKETS